MEAKERLLKVADFYQDKDLSTPIPMEFTVVGKSHKVYCYLQNDSHCHTFDMTQSEYKEVFFTNPKEISKRVKDYIARKYHTL